VKTVTQNTVITQEISPLPMTDEGAHKGQLGRVVVIGGCGGEVMMAGAPVLAANGALRTGAGLVQLFVPESIRVSALVMTPCSTARALKNDAPYILSALEAFGADAVAIGPGLGSSLTPEVFAAMLSELTIPTVIDADGLNMLATLGDFAWANSEKTVLTPHVGEARRLIAGRHIALDIKESKDSRRAAALAIVQAYACTVVLKGAGSVVTNGQRLYINGTGNAGMATAGTGDVLTGIIAALLAQQMDPFEASILGTYLHGLAGDFAAEELGRRAMNATDVIGYLPEAIHDHELTELD